MGARNSSFTAAMDSIAVSRDLSSRTSAPPFPKPVAHPDEQYLGVIRMAKTRIRLKDPTSNWHSTSAHTHPSFGPRSAGSFFEKFLFGENDLLLDEELLFTEPLS